LLVSPLSRSYCLVCGLMITGSMMAVVLSDLQDVIENQIYPPLSSGFSDENAYIRELTLKSILTLAPKMKQSTLTSNLLKHLSRLQVDIKALVGIGQA